MIKCICIDDTNKPVEIPNTHWVKKGTEYHINYIYKMLLQGNILGVTLSEIDLMGLKGPYECFRITRFAFNPEDIGKLLELAKDCAEFNDLELDFEKMLEEQCELVEK